MNSLNTIILEGNVTCTPEVKETSHGNRVCTLPIAVDRRYKNQTGEEVEEVSYFDIETWGALAEACQKYCPKGRGIRVVGRLKQNRWKTEEGKTRAHISIIAEHIEFKPYFHKTENSSGETSAQALADLAEAASVEKNSLDIPGSQQPDNSAIPVF